MAEKRIYRRSSRYNMKKPIKKSPSHWFRNLFLILVAGGSFMLFSYMGYLDYNVREQFEGKRWLFLPEFMPVRLSSMLAMP